MKKLIKAIPLPLSGVMLGCAALGNLLQSYSEVARTVFGAIAGILFVLLVCKAVLFPGAIREDMKSPVLASVAATFPMGMMLLSVYAKPFLGVAALWIWYIAIVLHVVLIVYFTKAFMLKPQLSKVFASYFIVYVGIAAASITSPAYGMQAVGEALFWFGLVCLLGLLVPVGIRYGKYREIPAPARPLFCIFAAPASLCLTGYLQAAAVKSLWLVAALAVLALLLYLLALAALPKLLRLAFYPSYAAFTFPFVISAIAIKQTAGYLVNSGSAIAALQPVVVAMTIIAALLVTYTLVRFCIAIVKTSKEQPVQA